MDERPDFGVDPLAVQPRRSSWYALLETSVAALVAGLILYWLDKSTATIEPTSVLVAVLPILFWLFFSGRIAGIKAFGVELKSAIYKSSNENIVLVAESIDYEQIKTGVKGRPAQIQHYVREGVRALAFELGQKHYYHASAIKQYLEELAVKGSLKWIVFTDTHGKFEGLITTSALHAFITENQDGYDTLVRMIEDADIANLPEMLDHSSALNVKDTKSKAIDRFSKMNFDELPVIGRNGQFVGIINRGKVLSSVISSILHAAEQ